MSNFESKISELIKNRGKARIWVDYILESYDKSINQFSSILTFHIPRQIGSIGIVRQHQKGKFIDLWKGINIGYFDLETNKEKERLEKMELLLKQAKKFKGFIEKRELKEKGV
jgi:hypothetical protein